MFGKHNENEGNDGSIWSTKVQLIKVLALTALLALASYGPALAAGVSGFGK